MPESVTPLAGLCERQGRAARNQRAAWFAAALDPRGEAFHLPGALSLRGPWSRAHLERAVQLLLLRHPALRTALVQVGDQLEQWVLAAEPPVLAVLDAGGLTAEAFTGLVRRWVAEPFDLRAGRPIRFALIERGEARYLGWVVHHTCFDGLSSAIMVRELRDLYAHALRGASLPQAPGRDPLDFAHWQAEFLRGARAARCRGWWRAFLEDLAPQTPGALAAAPGPIAVAATRLDRAQAANLRALAKRARVSLYSLYLSAFLAVLRPFAQRDDLALVSPFAGRPDPSFDATIGMFVNLVIMRQRLAGEMTLSQLLTAVGHTTLEVLDHADLPYDEVLRTQPGLVSDDPFGPFGACFVFQNWITDTVSGTFDGSASDMRLVDLAHERGGLPLTWEVYALADEVHLFLKYDTNRYPAERIGALAAALERLLLGFEAALPRPLDELGQALAAATFAPWQALSHWARERPDHPALLSQSGPIGYRDWLDRVRGLAEQLCDRGIGPESIVAIHATRTPATLAAMCAVVWAGAAYLPLDPALPRERHLLVLDEVRCHLIMAEPAACAELAGLGRVLLPVTLEHRAQFPPRQVPGEAAAYLLYTSGSSGRPKGVVVSRAALALFVSAAATSYGIDGEDRMLQLASLCFDTAVEELWLCLMRGATLVLDPAPLDGPPANLFDTIASRRISVLDLPTGLWHAWLEDPSFREVLQSGPLRTVIIGGERARPEAMRAFLASSPRPRLWNSYGPTEATVVCSLWRAEAWYLNSALEQVPLGEPLGRARLHVVDQDLRERPPDAEGELLIGGESLARGYLGAPALTAARFLPDPFSGLPGARLYRSGDRVRRDGPSGALVFLGRIDDQFKWRGYRVEPAEIERCLCAYPRIARAHVRPWRKAGEEARLVAWYLSDDPPEWRALRAWLLRELPAYMVPEAFVAVAQWPLTERGKLDPSALPAPRHQPVRPLRALAGWEANLLQEIWCEVLGLDWVGDDDNFFELGGHSLTATRAASRIRQTLGRELSLRAFHEHPVFADQVRHLRQLSAQTEPPPPGRSTDAEAPLAPAQERLFLLTERAVAARAYHVAGALQLSGPHSADLLELALNPLVQRHGALRTAFVDGPRQREWPSLEGALTVVDLAALPEPVRGASRDRLAAEWAGRAFCRARPPLWRVALLRLDAAEANLIWVMDHLICDAWSQDLLLQEWAHLYEAILAGRAAALSPLAWRYADYAAWRRVENPAESGRHLAFWRARLAGLPEVLPLPLDRPRGKELDPRGGMLAFEVTARAARDLQALAQRLGVSLFSVLLTAWSLVLARVGGSDDIPVGCPVADRGHLAFEGVVGFFVDTVVLRLQLPPGLGPTFADLVRHHHRACLEAFAHPQLPFEKLVAELPGERTPAVHPLFQVTYQHLHGATAGNLGPCRCEGLALDFALAPFDLSLLTLMRGERLCGRLTYRTPLFSAATAARLVDHLCVLLTSALSQGQVPAMTLDMIGHHHRRLLLEVWSANPQPLPGSGDLALDFETVVARHGALEALRKDERRLSYDQLNRESNRLAHQLRHHGVTKGRTVGVCLRPGPTLVVAFLAVIKAGGVYVALDPEYPIDRIAFLVEDTALDWVVSDERAVFSFDREITVISPSELPSELPDHNPVRAWRGGRAYICHTSGSTGRPKGVVIPQAGVLRLAYDTNYLRLGPGDRVAQAAHPAFDAITFEIWGTLLHGATLIHLDKQRLLQPRLLARWLRDQGLTAMFLTTAVFNLCAREQPDLFRPLRYLLFGGELVDPELVARVQSQGPPTHLLHVYGPTESTTFSSWYPVTAARADDVPIGGPIANTQLFVLDRRLQPVPPGVVGELYLGGLGLAEGYLNCPRQTAESFVPHPFASEPGQRLYRSGDAVRQGLAPGRLVFVNRLDHQAKIRGFRVEPAEVESVLRRAPGVRDCLVRAIAPPHRERYLAAWVVAPEQALDDLRRGLEDLLPRFMVPAVLMAVEDLPLTANGKVDWRALPDPERHRLSHARQIEAPRTELERVIHDIWRDLLGGLEFGTTDNFFSLGAHSLMMARACGRLSEALGLGLPLEVLFDHPSVAELARYLELAQWSRAVTLTAEPAEEEGLI